MFFFFLYSCHPKQINRNPKTYWDRERCLRKFKQRIKNTKTKNFIRKKEKCPEYQFSTIEKRMLNILVTDGEETRGTEKADENIMKLKRSTANF